MGDVVRAGRSRPCGGDVHTFPFDVVIMNGEVIGPKHAPYELGLLLSLPFGAIGYLSDGSNGDAARGPMRHLPPNRGHPAEAATAHGGGC